MNLYALVENGKVTQLKESENMPESPTWMSIWVDVTNVADIRVGWRASLVGSWTFTAPTEQELKDEAQQIKWQLLTDASNWVQLNSLQFKADLSVATPQEQALLLLHKQYCIAVSDINEQAGYPTHIDWPVKPY